MATQCSSNGQSFQSARRSVSMLWTPLDDLTIIGLSIPLVSTQGGVPMVFVKPLKWGVSGRGCRCGPWRR